MRLTILTIQDVAERHLCCGCGACAYMSPDEIEMIDVADQGRRPRFKNGNPKDVRSKDAMRICPGIELEHTFNEDAPGLIREMVPTWGPILEVWEGYAADPELRYAGSSGGVSSALGLYGIERGGMHGVLHIASRPDVPYLNHTVLSTTRNELLLRTGSRYAPASPCDGLRMIEDAPRPCVFIGKPCDVAAVQQARKIRPALHEKLGVTIAFFCAGTPSTQGTLEMLKHMGIDDPSALVSLRYRGNGWPGKAIAIVRTRAGEETRELTYEQSWGEVLTNYKQWRCKICPDHSGEFADIAVGDPWYRPIGDGEPGRSLILARSELGLRLLRGAINDGYLAAQPADPLILPRSQPNLLKARGAVWGRLLGMRVLGLAAPRFKRFPLFAIWWSMLDVTDKARSFFGTIRRVISSRIWSPAQKIPHTDRQTSTLRVTARAPTCPGENASEASTVSANER